MLADYSVSSLVELHLSLRAVEVPGYPGYLEMVLPSPSIRLTKADLWLGNNPQAMFALSAICSAFNITTEKMWSTLYDRGPSGNARKVAAFVLSEHGLSINEISYVLRCSHGTAFLSIRQGRIAFKSDARINEIVNALILLLEPHLDGYRDRFVKKSRISGESANAKD